MPKNPKFKLDRKNTTLPSYFDYISLPTYFDYIFAHRRQKAQLKPKLSPKFLSTSGPNPARIRSEKPDSTYNSGVEYVDF